eukprot:235051-Chlamydomonas_euryale.AAC.1
MAVQSQVAAAMSAQRSQRQRTRTCARAQTRSWCSSSPPAGGRVWRAMCVLQGVERGAGCGAWSVAWVKWRRCSRVGMRPARSIGRVPSPDA